MTAPEKQMRLVIVGATGMVGGYALRYALDHPAVELVTTIGRRKIGVLHSKLNEVLHQDFADCSALADVLSRQDAAVFCLGTYTGSVSDAELRTITAGYTIEFARVLRTSSPTAAFSFLSGKGADPTGRSRMAFARYKGEAEKALLASSFPWVYIFRPAYIYPVQPRQEPNLSYRVLRAIYPLFRVLFPNQVIRADDLARAMVDVVVRVGQEPRRLVLENRDIRAIVGSVHRQNRVIESRLRLNLRRIITLPSMCIVPSNQAPSGSGEPPVSEISLAVVKALYHPTAKRYRALL
jgi:uncharacterized protein YbjT (DUF2867 family)